MLHTVCVCVCVNQSIISALDLFFCTNAVLHKSRPMLFSMLLQVVQHTMNNVYIRVNLSKLQVLFVSKTNTVEKCTFRIIIKKSYRIKIPLKSYRNEPGLMKIRIILRQKKTENSWY